MKIIDFILKKRRKNPGFLLRKTRDNIDPEAEIENVYFNENQF